MIKVLKIILTVLVTSFFFFPIEFSFLPGLNTKNIMAAVGLVLALILLVRQGEFSVPKELLLLLLLSGMVSLMSLVSITYNQTPDTTYVSFIRATAIWLSSAFTAACTIREVHGKITVSLVIHYLIGVCLFQCVMAMLIEFIPAIREFVDRFVMQGQSMLQKMNRLYGFGASLDVAGSRFAAVLVAIAYLLSSSTKRVSNGLAVFYTLSFIVIAVIGNMIARTTTIGMIIGVLWVILFPFINRQKIEFHGYFGKGFAIVTTGAALIVISIALYRFLPDIKKLFEFGFEGFFSLFETGEWQVSSNDKLSTMVVWPEELRTWIIGDGYFMNSRYDPNYLGEATNQGFYMGTDIGYLRFIFYFGIAGLIWIIAVIAYSAYVCGKYFKDYAWMFALALLVGLVVWAKVSTDLFLFFALFLCAAALQETPVGIVSDPPAETPEASV